MDPRASADLPCRLVDSNVAVLNPFTVSLPLTPCVAMLLLFVYLVWSMFQRVRDICKVCQINCLKSRFGNWESQTVDRYRDEERFNSNGGSAHGHCGWVR